MLSERLVPIYFIFCLADIYMLHRFFASIFQRRRSDWRIYFFFVAAVSCAFIENSWGLTWVNLISMPVLYFLYVLIQFRISFKNGVIYTLIFYAIFAGGEAAFTIFCRFLSEGLSFPIVSLAASIGINFSLIGYMFRFLFLLFLERYTKKMEADRNQNIAWYLLILPVISILILSCFIYLDFPEQVLMQTIFCVGALLLYFSNAVIFIILERYTIIMNRIRYEEVYRAKQGMELDNLQNMIRLNEKYRCFIHDIHSYLNNLRILALEGRNQEVAGMISEIEGGMQEEIGSIAYSGNAILNAVLTERSAKARQDGIQMEVFVENFLRTEFIADGDMIPMFGNLLDNALEAAGKCEADNRYVNVKFFMGNPYMFVLYIENTFTGERKYDGEELATTKDNAQEHGMGVRIARKLTEKYGGTLSLETRGKVFLTTLAISAMGRGQR